MSSEINFVIPDEVVTEVATKLSEVINLIKPFTIALTPTERQAIPKMSDGTEPFVQKCIDYCQSNPEFAPAYTNVHEMGNDMKVYRQLIPLYRLALQIENMLNDTTMEAGAETYVAALSYYNSVKYATKMNAAGAKAIAEDLGKRFVKAKTVVPAAEKN